MDINFDLLGDFGKSLADFSYDSFYAGRVEIVKKMIVDYDRIIETEKDERTKRECIKIKDYYSAILADEKYMKMYVDLSLKYQVDTIMGQIYSKSYKAKGGSISTLAGVGCFANDLDEYVQNGLVSSNIKDQIEMIPPEKLRRVIYSVVGLEYTPRDKLMEVMEDDSIPYEEKETLLFKNGFGINGQPVVAGVPLYDLAQLERCYEACNVSSSSKGLGSK